MDDIELITKFSEKLGKLLDDDVNDYNVKLIIGQEPNKRLFKAHLYILRVICPYFHTAFKRGWCKKDDDGSFFIEKPNIKPEDIYEQTLWYYINPTLSRKQLAPIRTGLFDSALLKLKHFSLICNWINKSSELYSYPTLRFELKIRGTLDGFTADIFHNKFERLENTIVVMRIKDTGELIGGYNPWSFEHDRWRDSSDFWRYEQSSFIFSFPRESISLTNKNNLSWMKHNKINFKMELKNLESKSKLSRIDPNHTSKAFCISRDTGPQFGKTDLFMGKIFNSPLNCSCIQQYYMDKIRDDESGFCVDEYEIFQIFKK
ncbi:4679_t:CDS:2 [Funneliformis caledonium]|uniref:4679_t:CDS:1 n=1 Tax=Funneliformis caledonium TaxID=1117310 RepID=A0A9N8WJI8_9GLOM|nr:4679_t:CDS:2 [Funneliformis caledonium]